MSTPNTLSLPQKAEGERNVVRQCSFMGGQVDFIINYDIKYRMDKDNEEE